MHRYAAYILLIQLFVAPCIQALGILLPLYLYPDTNCAAWSTVSEAISANSNAQWYIIINPDNGPGATDELYQTCVSHIPASANQIIMGYVDASGGNVNAEVDTYAGWPTSSRPDGIYFDNISPTTSQLSKYEGYISHAKSDGFTFIGLDPGEAVSDSSYFSIADLINTYEDSYSSFNPSSLTGTMSKQSVILVNSPTTGTYTSVISQLESLGTEAVYISTVSDSNQALPAQLSEFASEVAASGAASSGSTGSSGSSGSTDSSGSTGSSGTTSSPGSTSSPNSNVDVSSGTSSAPSNPNTSVSGSSATAASTTASSISQSSSTSPASQSTPLKGVSISTSSAQSPGSSGSSTSPGTTNDNPAQAAAASHKGPPVAAIVGGVLGALIILLILLIISLCMRRRRRKLSFSASRDSVAAASFIQLRNPSLEEPAARFTEGSIVNITDGTGTAPSQSWNTDIKAPLPQASTSGDTSTLADENSSIRVSYPRTTRLSAAPTYGSAWDSLAGASGPPPSYHHDG
ncbi:Spherulation-specific family 4-domain-containing protein [Mycena sanguinolenta]|nr:Spherulation-specific family 4-domain-containing protein [Mycena sanguinolenta]